MAIESSAVITTGSTIYTCPGVIGSDEREYAVTCIMFCNNSNQTINLTVHYVARLSTVNNSNMVIKNLSLPAGETFTFDTEKVVLATGDRIQAFASVNPDGSGLGINATVSSMRVS